MGFYEPPFNPYSGPIAAEPEIAFDHMELPTDIQVPKAAPVPAMDEGQLAAEYARQDEYLRRQYISQGLRPPNIGRKISGPREPGDEILNPIQSDKEYENSVALTKTPQQRSFEAGFVRQNPIASEINAMMNTPAVADDPNYDVWQDIKGTEFERYWSSFVTIRNKTSADALKARILKEEKMKEMEDSSWWGTLGGVAGGLMSPTVLLPGLSIGRAAAGGISVSMSALRSAGLGALAVGIDEAFLQGSQVTREGTESVVNIGAGAVIGGLLGGVVARSYSRAEVQQAYQAYQTINKELLGGSLSAAEVDRFSREQLNVSGTMAYGISKTLGFMNPNLRGHNAVSPEARLVMQNLSETSLYTKLNGEGITAAPGGAAETDFKTQFNAYNAQGARILSEGFNTYTQGGGKLNWADYNLELARSLRNAGESSIPEIANVAKQLKNQIYDPLLRAADEVGLLTPSEKVLGAEGYLTRRYLRDKIIARKGMEDSFENAIMPQAEQYITEAYQKSQERTAKAVRRLEEENKLLAMNASERQQELLDIESGIARAEFENPIGFEVLSEIQDIQRQIAKLSRDKAKGLEVSEGQIEALKSKYKDLYASTPQAQELKKIIDGFKKRRQLTNKGFGGAEEKFDKINDKLIDLDESSIEGLKRLITAGRKFERELNKLGTEDDLAEKILKLNDDFAQAGKGYDDNLDQLAEIRRNMEGELEARAAKSKEEGLGFVEGYTEYKKLYDKINSKIDQLEKSAARHQTRLNKIAEKINEAEATDIPAIKAELEQMNRDLMEVISEATFKKNQRMIRLMEEQGNYKPEVVQAEIALRDERRKRLERKFYDRWDGGSIFPERDANGQVPDFKRMAKEYVDSVVEQITHVDMANTADDTLDYKIASKLGPMKDRILPFSDHSMEDFLDNDVSNLVPYYSRIMSAQIALSRMSQRLGGDGSPTLKDVVKNVSRSYDQMKEAIGKAKDIGEIEEIVGAKVQGLGERAWDQIKSAIGRDPNIDRIKERVNTYLDKQQKTIESDIFDIRDMMLGRYAVQQSASNTGRVLKSGAALSYIKDSGGFAISALPDMVRPAMVHGLLPYMDGIQHALRRSEPFLRQLKDAHLAGIGLERWTNGRMADMAEITNPYREGTQAERLLHNMSKFGTKWNGISLMQDGLESVDQMLSQNKIISGLLEGKDTRFLAFLGIDEKSGMAERMRKMLSRNMEEIDGIRIANTERWEDEGAARAYRNALFKDVTSTIVRPGLGDVPKFFKTPLGQFLFQYRSFALASNQRILLRGMQEDGARFASGLVGMTIMGVAVGALKAWRNGSESWERYKKKAENPGFLIGDGLDQAGFFAALFEVANSAEKASRIAKASFNPIKDPLDAIFGGTGETNTQKSWGKGFAESMFGPAVSLPTDLLKAAGSVGKFISGGDLTTGEKRGMVRAMPYSTFPVLKEINQLLIDDSPYRR